MAIKHTPKPWRVKDSDDDPYGDITILGGVHQSIAKMRLDDAPCPDFNSEQYANANLIAAAPYLLEALKPFANYACELETGETCDCHNCRARDAITRAIGGDK